MGGDTSPAGLWGLDLFEELLQFRWGNRFPSCFTASFTAAAQVLIHFFPPLLSFLSNHVCASSSLLQSSCRDGQDSQRVTYSKANHTRSLDGVLRARLGRGNTAP